MNPVELYEAYLGVYDECLTEGKKKEIRRTKEYFIKGYRAATGSNDIPPDVDTRATNAAKNIVKTLKKESQDYYDLILDYLLDEGFASNLDSAQMIMSHMSQDWIDDIVENKATERPYDVTRTSVSRSEFENRPINLPNPDFISTGMKGRLTSSGQRRVTRQKFKDMSNSTTQGNTRRPGVTLYYNSGNS